MGKQRGTFVCLFVFFSSFILSRLLGLVPLKDGTCSGFCSRSRGGRLNGVAMVLLCMGEMGGRSINPAR